MISRWLAILGVVVLAGCWNSDNARNIELGDVSIGQQMIDLKRALDENAISADEYAELKGALMSLQSACQNENGDDHGK